MDLLFSCGPDMAALSAAVPAQMDALHTDQQRRTDRPADGDGRAGDVVTVKGSLGSRMAPVVEALLALDAGNGNGSAPAPQADGIGAGMLYNLLAPLADDFQAFNLFRYLTFRTGGAMMTALFLSFLLRPRVINWLKSQQGAGQPIRDDGPESHLAKAGTPTMGGFLILLALCSHAVVGGSDQRLCLDRLLVTVGFGAVGFGDDYLKLTKRNSKGLPGKLKLVCEIAIAGIAAGSGQHHAGAAVDRAGRAVPQGTADPLGWFCSFPSRFSSWSARRTR